MRRTASEVIRELQHRIATLENVASRRNLPGNPAQFNNPVTLRRTPDEIKEIIEEGLDEFWGVVVDKIPEGAVNDLPDMRKVDAALFEALMDWLNQ